MQNHPYSWTKRRRFMYAVAVFCMGVISYILLKDLTSSVAETAVVFAFGTLFGILGSYVFGATWQDITHMKVGKTPDVRVTTQEGDINVRNDASMDGAK